MNMINKHKWYILFFVWIVLGPYLLFQGKNIFPILFDGFWGNVTAGIFTSIAILLLALAADQKTNAKIDRIVDVTKESERMLSQRERMLMRELVYNGFIEFLKKGNSYCVRFKNLKRKDGWGLEYEILPCHDEDGTPKQRKSENFNWYVIKVVGYAYPNGMERDDLIEHEKSPIKLDEHYYCEFSDDSWRMSTDGFHWHEFHLSGRVGPCESVESANCFMGFDKEPDGMEKICTLYLDDNGDPVSEGGCTPYTVYRADKGALFLKIYDSPLKSLYVRKIIDRGGEESLVIENIAGYLPDEEKLKKQIAEKLEKENVNIPVRKVHTFMLDNYEK